jgi:energy-coupling factor transport system ATP-binding protein
MAMALGNSDASLIESELRKLGLQGSMNRYPYNLSLGEKRRLSVRLMTLAEPNIILLDEPTYGQDRRRCYDLMQEMNRLNAKGTTVVFITHNMRLVAEFANHVIALKDGKVVYDGDKHPFFSDRKILNELALDQTPAMKVATGLFGTPCLLSVSEFNHAMKSAKAVIDN